MLFTANAGWQATRGLDVAAEMVQFGLLGPVEARDGDRAVELGRRKQRALLAVLLVHANEVVALDRLIEELWGEEPPPRATASLQTYISNLRRALEPTRPARAPSRVLVTQPPGYRLVVAGEDLDAARFVALTAEGHRLLEAGQPRTAARALRDALALWRGPALADVADEPFARAECHRLEELRLAAMEDRLAADIELGGHAAAVAELEELVAVHRFRERLHGLLMLALYRSGRQAEALQAFQAARRTLREELGIDPSRWLRQLESDMLRQAPALDWSPPRGEPRPSTDGVDAARPAPAASAARPAPDELVGRDEQLHVLDEILAGARAGDGRMVVVAGEPGIGKTRLVEEVARRARAEGMQVAWGRCYEGEGAPAFWPWAQVVRQLLADVPPGQLQTVLRGVDAVLGHLVPELTEPATVPDRSPGADLGSARFRLNQTVTELLRGRADGRPLLVIVDDLHWADAASLSLLTFLAGGLAGSRLVVLGTYRDVEVVSGQPLADTLGSLARQPTVARLWLRGLARTAVARLIGNTIAATPAEPLVEVVHDRTGGNPFFVTALLSLLKSEGRLAGGEATAAAQRAIPAGVRDVLHRRLGRLPGQTNAVLVAAAVVGRGFDLDVVEAMTGLEDEPALDAVEAAVLAGLVVEDDRSVGRYHFAHTLVRETIYDDLGRTRRARLHARVVDALVATRGPEPEPVLEMAHHCWHSASVIGPVRALPHLLRAGEEAIAQLAYESAHEQFERALTLVGRLPASAEADELEIRTAVRLAVARLRIRGYADPDVGHALTQAWELSTKAGMRTEPMDVLWALYCCFMVRAELGPAGQFGVELLAMGRDRDDSAFLAAGHTALGIEGLYRGNFPEAEHQLERAVEASRRIEAAARKIIAVEPTVLCQGYLGVAKAYRGNIGAGLRLTGEAVASARRVNEPYGLVNALIVDAWAAVLAGEAARAHRDATEAVELSRTYGFGPWELLPAAFHGWAEARGGDPDGGERRLRSALLEMEAVGARTLRPLVLGLLVEVQLLAGRSGDAAATLRLAGTEAERLDQHVYDAQLEALRAGLGRHSSSSSLPSRTSAGVKPH